MIFEEAVGLTSDRIPIFLIHYGAPEWLRRATDSVLQSDIGVDVNVVNNGPEGVELDLDSRINVINTGGNVGYTGGANRAIAHWLGLSTSDLCVIGAHDMLVTPNTIRLLAEAMRTYPALGMAAPSPGEKVTRRTPSGHLPGVDLVEWASGTCLMLRRSAVEIVGPLDEDFHSYGEDIDYGRRMNAAGFKVGIVRDASVAGQGSASRDAFRLMFVNRVRLRLKHESRGRAWKLVLVVYPAFFARDLTRALIRRDSRGVRRAFALALSIPEGIRVIRGARIKHDAPAKGAS